MLIRTFYSRVTLATHDSIDSKAGCSLMRKTVDKATIILETMAFDSCLWPVEQAIAPKAASKIEVDGMTAL